MLIETTNLVLRIPGEADFEAWAELNTDEIAMRFIGGPRDRVSSWMGLAAVVRMWSMRGYGLFSLLDRATGRWIGRVGPWVPEGALGTEIGWALARAEWGKGRATEAAAAAMGWAFETLGWTEVIHCIAPDNRASIAVAERLGSRWQRDAVDAYGETVRIYGQSRQDWPRPIPRSSSS